MASDLESVEVSVDFPIIFRPIENRSKTWSIMLPCRKCDGAEKKQERDKICTKMHQQFQSFEAQCFAHPKHMYTNTDTDPDTIKWWHVLEGTEGQLQIRAFYDGKINNILVAIEGRCILPWKYVQMSRLLPKQFDGRKVINSITQTKDVWSIGIDPLNPIKKVKKLQATLTAENELLVASLDNATLTLKEKVYKLSVLTLRYNAYYNFLEWRQSTGGLSGWYFDDPLSKYYKKCIQLKQKIENGDDPGGVAKERKKAYATLQKNISVNLPSFANNMLNLSEKVRKWTPESVMEMMKRLCLPLNIDRRYANDGWDILDITTCKDTPPGTQKMFTGNEKINVDEYLIKEVISINKQQVYESDEARIAIEYIWYNNPDPSENVQNPDKPRAAKEKVLEKGFGTILDELNIGENQMTNADADQLEQAATTSTEKTENWQKKDDYVSSKIEGGEGVDKEEQKAIYESFVEYIDENGRDAAIKLTDRETVLEIEKQQTLANKTQRKHHALVYGDALAKFYRAIPGGEYQKLYNAHTKAAQKLSEVKTMLATRYATDMIIDDENNWKDLSELVMRIFRPPKPYNSLDMYTASVLTAETFNRFAYKLGLSTQFADMDVDKTEENLVDFFGSEDAIKRIFNIQQVSYPRNADGSAKDVPHELWDFLEIQADSGTVSWVYGGFGCKLLEPMSNLQNQNFENWDKEVAKLLNRLSILLPYDVLCYADAKQQEDNSGNIHPVTMLYFKKFPQDDAWNLLRFFDAHGENTWKGLDALIKTMQMHVDPEISINFTLNASALLSTKLDKTLATSAAKGASKFFEWGRMVDGELKKALPLAQKRQTFITTQICRYYVMSDILHAVMYLAAYEYEEINKACYQQKSHTEEDGTQHIYGITQKLTKTLQENKKVSQAIDRLLSKNKTYDPSNFFKTILEEYETRYINIRPYDFDTLCELKQTRRSKKRPPPQSETGSKSKKGPAAPRFAQPIAHLLAQLSLEVY